MIIVQMTLPRTALVRSFPSRPGSPSEAPSRAGVSDVIPRIMRRLRSLGRRRLLLPSNRPPMGSAPGVAVKDRTQGAATRFTRGVRLQRQGWRIDLQKAENPPGEMRERDGVFGFALLGQRAVRPNAPYARTQRASPRFARREGCRDACGVADLRATTCGSATRRSARCVDGTTVSLRCSAASPPALLGTFARIRADPRRDIRPGSSLGRRFRTLHGAARRASWSGDGPTRFKSLPSPFLKAPSPSQFFQKLGGEGGIRTLGRLLAYARLASGYLRPLGHLSGFRVAAAAR
jgi:hypothetical protein